MGKVKIRFAESNPFGVVDHDVILESGVRIHNPCASPVMAVEVFNRILDEFLKTP